MQKTITIAISCFNTSKTISELLRRVKEVAVRNPSHRFELVLVDDGSADDSFEVACAGLQQTGLPSIAIRFSKNFGQMAAILIGLKEASGDAVVILSSDLQDPPELINDFISHWEHGFDMVGGDREKRSDGPVRDIGGFLWYRLFLKNTIPGFPRGGADYALISREISDGLLANHGSIRYLQAEIVRHAKNRQYVKYVRQPGVVGRRSGWNVGLLIRHIMDGYIWSHAVVILANVALLLYCIWTNTLWQMFYGVSAISIMVLIAFNGLLHSLLAQRIVKSLNIPVSPMIETRKEFNVR
jgi:dolichol-phosphate mannosyltransferase